MEKSFTQKALIVGAIALACAFIFIGLRELFHLLLLVFAGALIAVYFRKLAELLTEHTKLNHRQSMTIVIVGNLAVIVAFVRGFGAKISEQTKDFQGQIPQLTQTVTDKLSQNPIGDRLLQQGKKLQEQGNGGGQQSLDAIASFFSSTFGILGDLYIVFILSIYFTATPQLYKRNLLYMIPVSRRDKAKRIIEEMYENLGKWIVGQLLAMVIVAAATSITLSIMGVPYALLFGLVAGALNFIPNFGPLIAMIPTALVALTVSPALALGVIIAFIVIQNIEGEFLTPLIQQKMVKLLPAAIIFFQILMTIIAGGIGIVLATPLLVVVMVLIQRLYVKPVADKK